LIWLEEVLGEEALAWVKAQNEKSVAAFGNIEESEEYKRILAILDSKEKIPYVGRIGEYYYNFWQDAEHKRGLWRRTTIAGYKSGQTKWETVLDLDELSSKEGVTWVYKGANVLDEGIDKTPQRALLTLSPGGSDAVVLREFDLETKQFIPESEQGFVVPESKSRISWISRDEVAIGTDFGPGSLTASGYPRVSKIWRRGQPLSEAVTVFEGKKEDVAASQHCSLDRGIYHEFRIRSLDFYHRSYWYRRRDPAKSSLDPAQGEFREVPVPTDVDVDTFKDTFLLTMRENWTLPGEGSRVFKKGSLLSIGIEDAMAGKFEKARVVFEPTPRRSLMAKACTHNYMVLNVADNVNASLHFYKYVGEGKFEYQEPPAGQQAIPIGCDVQVRAVYPKTLDDIFLIKDGYLEPDKLEIASAKDCATTTETLYSKPHLFDSTNLMVEQHQATSKDGTKVPYFMIRHKEMEFNGSNPTLVDGYGGFEIPLLPGYAAGVGAVWLQRGGVKVVANIRGGGEFGPEWHQSALRENRCKAYEDFEAVGRDLIERGVTRPECMACIGGSNGGLLVGNMLTREGAALWGSIVCQVPLLDMKRFHKLLAGASWMAEYGNPDVPEDWKFLKNYSPYQRIHDVCLQPGSTWKAPETLFTTSTRDDRVHPGHARKMVKRLQDDVPPEKANTVLYWENTEGGHGGAADNGQRAFMWALVYRFLWATIGEKAKPDCKLLSKL